MFLFRHLFPLFFSLFIWAIGGYAGNLTPDLERRLQSSVPNDEISVIITLSEQVDLKQFEEKDAGLRRSKIVKALKDKADKTQGFFKTFLKNRGASRIISLWIKNGIAVTAQADVIRGIENLPGVERVVFDDTISPPVKTPAAPASPEWNLTAIHVPELWALGITGQGVVVANMDTGVDLNHPDLQGKWRGGTNSWFDPNGEHATPYDADGHGTQTMGILVGGTSGGTAIGVAPGAKWIAVKIFNDRRIATLSAIHQAFQWLLDPDDNPDTDDAPDVVNASWGLGNVSQCATEFDLDIQALKAANIAVAFSAGNSGPNSTTSISPANNPGAFAVGATDIHSTIASFSSRGPSACDGSIFPHVVAPGVNIKTSDLTSGGIFPDSYVFVSGTSFSAPHVAGEIALLRSAFPGLSVPEIEWSLKYSAQNLSVARPDNTFGYGLIDALGAYNTLTNLPFTAQIFTSIAIDDGWILESQQGSGVGGFTGSTGLFVGDDFDVSNGNRQFKSIVSFDTSRIPIGSLIKSASLKLKRKNQVGIDPFTAAGVCTVDVAKGTFNEQVLEMTDFQATATATQVAIMSHPTVNGAISMGSLNESGLEAVNEGGITQMRVYFSIPENNNNNSDYVVFYSGDDEDTGNRPLLEVVYLPLRGEADPGIWYPLTGSTISAPALVHNPVINKLILAVRAADDSIWIGTFHDRGYFNEDWRSIPGRTASAPALVWNPVNQKTQIVVRAADDSLWSATFNSNGDFNNNWSPIPGATPSSPSLAWNPATNHSQIVVRALDDSLWSATFSSDETFNNNWTSFAGASPSSPSIVWNPMANQFQIAVRAADDSLWTGTFDANGFFNNDWISITGATSSAPALVWDDLNSEISLVVRASDDSIWSATFSSNGSFNNHWLNISGRTISSPGMAYFPTIKRLGIVVRGSDDSLWRMSY